MKLWWLLLVPGGALVAAFALGRWYLRRRRARERAHAEALIAANRAKPIYRDHDDALRKRTEARRDAAEGIRRRAAHIESGAAVTDVIRMVKR